jgi:mRNA interferase RelE/StbE
MASYKIEWKSSAAKELRKLDKGVIFRIIKAVDELSKNPIPSGSRKLRGAEFTYRIRTGNYRIIYSIHSNKLIIEIIRIGHRRDVYRK